MNAVIYIHGKGGSATESEHYMPLFPDNEVIGLDYQTFTPWETGKEIRIAVEVPLVILCQRCPQDGKIVRVSIW
ncbi:hypothetical protein [Segatella bryantii]|uniref:hypothetical protein n=1 Tax=Segatella bryantii TaxID=77095 RepID=UPI00242D53F1|nr:hypothetical protein [Segatella bryantii]